MGDEAGIASVQHRTLPTAVRQLAMAILVLLVSSPDAVRSDDQPGNSSDSTNASGWSTFRSERYEFEIKHPSDWRAHELEGGDRIARLDGPGTWKQHIVGPSIEIVRQACGHPSDGFSATAGTPSGRSKRVCVLGFTLELSMITQGIDTAPYERLLETIAGTFVRVERSAHVLDAPPLPEGKEFHWKSEKFVFQGALSIEGDGKRPFHSSVDLSGTKYSSRFSFRTHVPPEPGHQFPVDRVLSAYEKALSARFYEYVVAIPGSPLHGGQF